MSVRDLPAQFRAEAAHLEPYAPAAAVAWRAAAARLDAELIAADGEALTLSEAAKESGYSPDHLRHMVAGGTLENAGTKGRPRIRRGELPKKAKAAESNATYDATADAISINSRRLERSRDNRAS
jgi:hypothetical protein